LQVEREQTGLRQHDLQLAERATIPFGTIQAMEKAPSTRWAFSVDRGVPIPRGRSRYSAILKSKKLQDRKGPGQTNDYPDAGYSRQFIPGKSRLKKKNSISSPATARYRRTGLINS
jgi:hypothetical protein